MVSILYYSPKQSENKQRDHNNKAVFEWYTKMCFYDIKSSDSTTCNCKEKCAAGQVNTDCPVCKTNMSECTGTAPATPEPDKDAETDAPAPKPEKKSNVGMILVIFALAGAAGAAYYYIKFVKGRKPKDEDLDFFDDEGYEEEPYINEDEEPQIAEDAETDGDED